MVERASAGKRDRYVTLQRVVAGSDKGLPIDVAGAEFKIFAARNDLMGSRERMSGAQVSAGLETEWTLPYLAELDPETVDVVQAFRLIYGGRTHDIKFAAMIGRKNGILLTTTVRVG